MVVRLTLFLLAAIVLIAFGIYAAAQASMTMFGVQWYIWFMASFLSYLVDIAVSWAPWARRSGEPVVVAQQ